jgi:hypothetical protein
MHNRMRMRIDEKCANVPLDSALKVGARTAHNIASKGRLSEPSGLD